ncbi:MAG: SCO family protein [Kiloniellales bacterium]|nr:SCO family protein [Kiloniellales bacterium]
MRFKRVLFVTLLIGAVLLGEWLWLTAGRDRSAPEVASVAPAQAVIPGGGFSLIDHQGQPSSETAFPGKHLVLVFGYTFCPDVCPTTLASLASALDLLGERAAALQPLFVTIDPERDTPEVLADYVAAFHPRLVGLTGSPEQIRKVARDYRVYYAKVGTDEADYLVDHSAYIYLIGPDGRTLTYLKHDESPEILAAKLGGFLDPQTSDGGETVSAAENAGG